MSTHHKIKKESGFLDQAHSTKWLQLQRQYSISLVFERKALNSNPTWFLINKTLAHQTVATPFYWMLFKCV